ncbi:MAG TPA: glycosyltransferase family 2 protein [Dictyobacter sp.]|jgi:glycosyltransferase involved in cell wall biosynthesis|nr:glycosyltransferase family 2 protein [Dictyobacter sp.]
MRVSIVVPVYNEEKTIALVLERLSQVSLDLEVIVVDDASTDHTWEILETLRAQAPFHTYQYIRHACNQGKGVALRTGFRQVTGELVVAQDADMEYDPLELTTLVQKWEEVTRSGNTHYAIYGRRDLSPQKLTTRWGNRFLTQVTNILFGSHIQDMETCYKLMPSSIARVLPMEGRRFEIEPEITACLLQAGYWLLEVPISYKPRKEKKLQPWKDGWPALAMLFRRRFVVPFRLGEHVSVSDPGLEEVQVKQ